MNENLNQFCLIIAGLQLKSLRQVYVKSNYNLIRVIRAKVFRDYTHINASAFYLIFCYVLQRECVA